ncbi:MAG: helix-turn-helix domain-containing protein [Desulfovibrio sp.]|nr:helix-turn-helix domain-containing protein [Desulfovibrio sp.]
MRGIRVEKSGKATYTLAEAAALLSCHRETLRRAIKEGSLRAARLGRGIRISRLDLEAFWTACGGGDLFAREAGEPPAGEEARPGARKRKGRREQLQLPLLGDGAAGGVSKPECPGGLAGGVDSL